MHKFTILSAIIVWYFHLNWLTFVEAMKKIKGLFFPFMVYINDDLLASHPVAMATCSKATVPESATKPFTAASCAAAICFTFWHSFQMININANNFKIISNINNSLHNIGK